MRDGYKTILVHAWESNGPNAMSGFEWTYADAGEGFTEFVSWVADGLKFNAKGDPATGGLYNRYYQMFVLVREGVEKRAVTRALDSCPWLNTDRQDEIFTIE